MKRSIVLSALAVAGSMLLSGCFVYSRPGHSRGSARAVPECRPSYHWEGGQCVHNGNGRGNGHGKGHGHDHGD